MLETLKGAWRTKELRGKILFSLMILAIFRLGSLIPVPFLDSAALAELVSQTGNLLGYIDILSGGAFSQCTLFALSISPYITASIVMQLLTIAIPYLENLSKEGEEGKKRLNKITRYAVVAISLLQAFAYMMLVGNAMGAISYNTGWEAVFARVVIVLAFAAGAMLIVFLGEQIDQKGIGNGISLILFAGIVSGAPQAVMTMWEYLQFGFQPGQAYYLLYAPIVIIMFLAMIVFIIYMTNAERRIPIQYSKKVVGRKTYGGQSTHLPIKVNMSGVLPVIFASTLLSIPGTIKGFLNLPDDSFWGTVLGALEYDQIFFAILYFILILGFNYFYVSVQYNPIEISNNLRKNSGMVPGLRPGKPTSDYIARIVSKTTFLGGMFLGLIATVPIIIGAITGMNIALGGTSVIIIVGVVLDTLRQLESQMMMRHYKGFLE